MEKHRVTGSSMIVGLGYEPTDELLEIEFRNGNTYQYNLVPSSVWPCPLDFEGYAAAGRRVKAPRRSCPRCGGAMIFWGGYRRFVRAQRAVPIFIRRARCRACSTSHALIPAFVLTRRFDPVGVIGGALARAVAGIGLRRVAADLGVPHSTARDWRRRYRARAPTLAAGFAALAVELGGVGP